MKETYCAVVANGNLFFEIRMQCTKVFYPSVRAEDDCSMVHFVESTLMVLLVAWEVKWAVFAPLCRVIRSILSPQFHSALYQDFQVVIRNIAPH